MEWVLIAWLLSGSTAGGANIEHIPGFWSEQQCETAGEKYSAKVGKKGDFICIQRGVSR